MIIWLVTITICGVHTCTCRKPVTTLKLRYLRHFNNYIFYVESVFTVCSWMAELQKINNDVALTVVYLKIEKAERTLNTNTENHFSKKQFFRNHSMVLNRTVINVKNHLYWFILVQTVANGPECSSLSKLLSLHHSLITLLCFQASGIINALLLRLSLVPIRFFILF